jgi:hypothetical protein
MSRISGRGPRSIAAAALLVSAAAAADGPGPFPPAGPPRAGNPPPPGDDPLQKMTVWRGTTSRMQAYKFVITDRSGEAFKGYLQEVPDKAPKANPFGPSGPPRVAVEGTIKGGELDFRQAAARAPVVLTYRGKYENGKLKMISVAQPGAPPANRRPPRPGAARPAPAPETATAEFTFAGMAYATFPDLNVLYEPLAATDPRAAARELARLMSFPLTSPADGRRFPVAERLWLPFRGMKLASEGSGYPEAENAVRYRLDELAAKAPGPWRAAAAEARGVLTARLKLARFNQVYGNTPDASLGRDFVKFMSGMRRAANDLERELKKDEAAGRAGASDETLRAAGKLAYSGSPARIIELLEKESQGNGVPPPAEVTRYMTNADAVMAGEQSRFWARHLVPPLEAANLPAADRLVRADPVWASFDKNEAQGLSAVAYKNVSGRPLTNVVLELRLENEYREATTLYHYAEHWPADAVLRAAPHPAWGGQRAYHMGRFAGHLSAWSDQGKATRRRVEIVNDKLTPRANDLRREWKEMEETTRDKSMLMGRVVVGTLPLPPATKP